VVLSEATPGALLYFEWDKTSLFLITKFQGLNLRNLSHSIFQLGIWYLEFGIWDLINAEIYPVRSIVKFSPQSKMIFWNLPFERINKKLKNE